MADRKISATVSIGGTVDSSLGKAFASARKGAGGIADELKNIGKEIKSLEKLRAEAQKAGKATADLDKQLANLTKKQGQLQGKQGRLGAVGGMFSSGQGLKFGAGSSAILKRLVASEKLGPAVTKGLTLLDGALPILSAVATTTMLVAAAGAAAAGGIFMLGKSANHVIDSTADMADGLGVSVNNLLGLRYAAAQSGLAAEDFDGKLSKLQNSLESAKDGTGPASDALKELGISYQELSVMNPEEKVKALATAFKSYQGSVPKVTLAQALVGKNPGKMVNFLNQGAEGIEAQMLAARKAGAVFSAKQIEDADLFDKAWARVTQNFQTAWVGVGSKLMPVITDILGKIATWLESPKTQKKLEELGTALVGFAERMSKLLKPILDYLDFTLGNMIKVINAFNKVYDFSSKAGERIGEALFPSGISKEGYPTYSNAPDFRGAKPNTTLPTTAKPGSAKATSSSSSSSETSNTVAPVFNINLHGVTTENSSHMAEQMIRSLRDYSPGLAGSLTQ